MLQDKGTDAPMMPGAMRVTPALDGELIWCDSVPDAAPLRAVEVEALVWSTMTIPPYAWPWPPSRSIFVISAELSREEG